MNKTFTLLCGMAFAAVSATVNAAESVPVFAWGADMSSPQSSGDQCNGLAADDTGIYYIGAQGSPQAGGPLYFNDTQIGTGSKTDSNSANANLVLVKTDGAGNMLWHVTSSHGDIANNQGGVLTLADGSVVAVVKIRAASGFLADGIELVDGTGAVHKISDWDCAAEPVRSYRVMVLNISSSTGAINTISQVVTDISPVSNAGSNYKNGTPDGVNVNTVETDGVNIYLAGKYRKAMTFQKKSGDKVTLTPHSLDSWTGDTQTANGNIFIVKLDAQGYYLSSFTSESPVNLANVLALKHNGGRLYAAAALSGMAPDCPDVKLGSVTVSPSLSQSPLIMCLDTDLNVSWADYYPASGLASGKSFVWQNVGIAAQGDDLWISGMFNGKFTVAGSDVVVSSMRDTTPREGLLMHINASTGAWMGGVASSDSYGITVPGTSINCITGYFSPVLLPGDTDHVYMFGYGMNANVGTFLRRYDTATLKSDPETDAWNLVTGGGAPTCQSMVYDEHNGRFVCSSRGNREFNIFGSTEKIAPKGNVYGVVLTAFDMPYGRTSGVVAIDSASDMGVSVTGGHGTATVRASSDTTVDIYDICGRKVASVAVTGGETTVSLRAGLYVTRYGKILVR